MVQAWVDETQSYKGHRIVQCVHQDFYQWDLNKYRKIEKAELRAWWYKWFGERQFSKPTKDGVKIVEVKPDKHMMERLEDAARALCNVKADKSAHEPLILRTGKSMDLDRAVVFQNGIYYVKEDTLVPITPDIFLTTTLPFDYDPRAMHGLWDWFVADIFNGEQDCIDLLQEWMGYCLIASNHMQSMMFLFGKPGSGKSTVGSVIRAMLGGDRVAAANTDSFKTLFGPAVLVNKYLAIMAESRDTNKKDIDKLLQMWKAITGGDTLSVRRLYRDAVDARLFCRLMYIANDALPFDDTSEAMKGRTNLLYFPNNYRLDKPDRMLEYKLAKEVQGIALWAIEGLRRLLERDEFTVPKSSKEHLEGISRLSNPIGLMLEECCEWHVGAEFLDHNTPCDLLYNLWVAWCNATCTRNSLSRQAFYMRLRNLPREMVRERIMKDGKRLYVYRGLEVKKEAMELYLKV